MIEKNEAKLNLVKQLKDKVKNNSQDFDAWNKLGNAYLSLNRLQQAINAYKESIKIQPDFYKPFYNLGITYEADNQLDLAITAYKSAIKIKPDDHLAFNNLGAAYKATNQLDLAISAFKKAIQTKPDYYQAFNNLGIAHQANNQLGLAIAAYNSAVKIKPDYYEAYFRLGIAYDANNQRDLAIMAYHSAIKIKPDYYDAYFNFGIAYKANNQLDFAISAYKSAITIKPDYYQAFNNLGNAYQAINQLDLAIMAYNSAVKIKPDYYDAYFRLGIAYDANNQRDLAIMAYHSAIKIKPNYYDAYFNLGIAYRSNNQLELAISAYRSAITIKPDYYQAFYSVGIAHQANNQLGLAIMAYNTAIKIKPNYHQAFQALGFVFKVNNQFKQAIECFNKALQLEPFNPLYIINKASILYEIRKQGDAFELFNQLNLSLDINQEKTKLQLKKKYDLTDGNITYIANKIKQFGDLKQIMKHQIVFTSGTRIADKTAKVIFQNVRNVSVQGNDRKKQQQYEQKVQVEFLELRKQLIKQAEQLKKQALQINQLKEYSGLQISQKFRKLIDKDPYKADYYVQLVYRITMTIKSYQHLQTGMFQRGDEPIQSKTGVVASFLQKGLGLAEKIPLVESVASMIKGICEFYVGMEGQFVSQAIVSKFNHLDEREVNILIRKMVLSLVESPNFEKLFLKRGKQICWFEKVAKYYCKIFKKVNKLKDEALAKITDMKNAKISQNQNLAREHCVDILIILIMEKNQSRIQVFPEQFLTEAAKIFLDQKTSEPHQQHQQYQSSFQSNKKESERKQCPLM